MEALQGIIITFGYVGISVAVFAESGFLLGLFLPGDSLLFTIGLLSATGSFNIYILWIICVVAAIVGDSFGYWSGKKFGPTIFSREDSFFFRKSYVDKTNKFYERYGKKTIILARFVPIIRTLAPIFAGVGKMDYKTFISYNIIGGILWPTLLLFAGHFLGRTFPQLENYLSIVIIVIIILSVIPIGIEIIKHKRESSQQKRI